MKVDEDGVDYDCNPYLEFKPSYNSRRAKDFCIPGDVQGYDGLGNFGWITLDKNYEKAIEYTKKLLQDKYGLKFND
jgi:hypothetical protein